MQEEMSIRYEGRDAEKHEIDLNQLGISLQGFARILGVCGNFVETGKYNKQFDSLAVKVVAREPDEHHCYEVVAYIQGIMTSANFWSGTGGAVLTAVVAYVLSRRSSEEMKLLKDALDKSLANSAQMTERLISTIDKMAEALRPAARMATSPIDKTCNNIGIYASGTKISELDDKNKEYFSAATSIRFDRTKTYVGIFSELDTKTGSCKVSLSESEPRIQCEITDPIRSLPNNPYALALASQAPLSFLAKAEIDEDGVIAKLFISDLAPTTAPQPSAPSAKP
ncbi:DUF7946 domain-containing protein [Janthinobacterium sp. ROICE36]|uniref:DUF7946 domain-containing protein n=1 Tax=Janthinobacterium sp. ROICE36 TaxID=2048670 RepID=UPI0011AFB52E|nr:hypothetical protein [Janthinobacterium sp. ROICE36]